MLETKNKFQNLLFAIVISTMFVIVLGINTAAQTNVALGKTATQSTNYAVLSTADKAVDGKTDGNFANGEVTHTISELHPWWAVDLGTVYTIFRIDMYNRTDCCQERLKDFKVNISQDGINWTAYTPTAANATPYGYSITINPALARYVQVMLNGTGILSLAEVKVMAADVSANVKPISNPPQAQGGIAKLTRQQLEDEFRTCPEAQQYGESTDKDFTISLYWRYLGHAPDGNLQLHSARITNGQMTRQQLEDEFRTCPEAQQHGVSTTMDFTISLYWRYLGHAPDGNLQYHANRLIR